MSDDKDKEQEAAVVAASDEDGSSVFSNLEPPPPAEDESPKEKVVAVPNPPESKDDYHEEEEKEEIRDNNGKEESIMIEQDTTFAKMEEDVVVKGGRMIPQSNNNNNVVSKEEEEQKPSPLVHIGSTRGELRKSAAKNAESQASSSPSSGSNNNRNVIIGGICLCLFVIVIVQAVTLGLVLNQDASSSSDKKGTSSSSSSDPDNDPTTTTPRIPTLRPTTTPTRQNNVFASIANEPGAVRLNQVSFCDECTEVVRVSNIYLPWNAWTYLTEFEVSSNGYVNLYCWNYGSCGMIDIATLNLSPNVQGSIYILWEQEEEELPPSSVVQKFKADSRQQQQRTKSTTLTISFEEIMLFGFFDDDSPYKINAQVKISQGEINVCFGAGIIIGPNAMRTGFYNYTDSSYNYHAATGPPFDSNGYTRTFPAGTCQSFSSSLHGGGGGGGFVPTSSPTYYDYWYTNSPTPRWGNNNNNWYPTSRPSDWYWYPTPSPSPHWNWYPTTLRPSDYYWTKYPTPIFPIPPIYPTRYPTPTYDDYKTSSPTWSPTFAYFDGFEYIAGSDNAWPLETVSNCDTCTESTKFGSFPYKFRGRDNIWDIVVSSDGYLELRGDCAPRGLATCAVINVITTDLVPDASTIGDTIWAAETTDSYIYSFEYVPVRFSWIFGVEEDDDNDDAAWMLDDDDALLNRHLEDFSYPYPGNVSAQVHLFFDGQIDICWGDIQITEFNQSFISSIDDFVEDTTIPANGYYFDERGAVFPYRYPSFMCQTLLQSYTGPSPEPTDVPSYRPTSAGSSDKLNLLRQYYGEIEGDAGEWILTVDAWTLNAGAPPEMYAERYILAMLFFSTNSLGWSNQDGWLSSSRSVCEWAGIVCNRVLRVQEINLVSNGLSGSLPWQLGRLEFLKRLSVDHNRLQERFALNQLSTMSLSHISMRNATLTGTIPASVGSSLPRLTYLDLALNYLEGTIPSEILQLTDLTHLSLAENRLTGTIPSELAFLQKLEELYLAGNSLTGTIPTTISYLNRLRVFSAGNNALTGRLPPSMFLDMTSLRQLHLAYNRLTGTIPPHILLSELEQLELQNNQLTGPVPIPPQSLKVCNLSFNNFLQSIDDTGVCEV